MLDGCAGSLVVGEMSDKEFAEPTGVDEEFAQQTSLYALAKEMVSANLARLSELGKTAERRSLLSENEDFRCVIETMTLYLFYKGQSGDKYEEVVARHHLCDLTDWCMILSTQPGDAEVYFLMGDLPASRPKVSSDNDEWLTLTYIELIHAIFPNVFPRETHITMSRAVDREGPFEQIPLETTVIGVIDSFTITSCGKILFRMNGEMLSGSPLV